MATKAEEIKIPVKIEDPQLLDNIAEYPNMFKRQGAFPLDKFSLFKLKSDAENYATKNGVAYVGQIVTVIGDTESKNGTYRIEENGILSKFGISGKVEDVPQAETNSFGTVKLGTSATTGEAKSVVTTAHMADYDKTVAKLAGATFTGSVLLNDDPTENLEAATKQYVDTAVAGGIKYEGEISSIAVDTDKKTVTLGISGDKTPNYTKGSMYTIGNNITADIDGNIYKTGDHVIVKEKGLNNFTNVPISSFTWINSQDKDAVTLDGTQTLTNKTLKAPLIKTIDGAHEYQLPTIYKNETLATVTYVGEETGKVSTAVGNLDTKVFGETTGLSAVLDKKISENKTAIAGEIKRATEAEQALTTAVGANTDKLAGITDTVSAYVNTQVGTEKARVDELSGNVFGPDGLSSELLGKITEEVSRATGKEDELAVRITANETKLTGITSNVTSFVSTVSGDTLTAANAYTDGRETAITAAYTAADKTLSGNLTADYVGKINAAKTEVNGKWAEADIALSTSLSGDYVRKINAAKSGVESAFTEADKTLEDKITAEQQRADTAEKANAKLIGEETKRATAAEGKLNTAITTEVDRAKKAEGELDTAIKGEATAARAAEKKNAEAITTEKDRATAAEGKLDTAIKGEATARGKRDDELSEQIQGLTTKIGRLDHIMNFRGILPSDIQGNNEHGQPKLTPTLSANAVELSAINEKVQVPESQPSEVGDVWLDPQLTIEWILVEKQPTENPKKYYFVKLGDESSYVKAQTGYSLIEDNLSATLGVIAGIHGKGHVENKIEEIKFTTGSASISNKAVTLGNVAKLDSIGVNDLSDGFMLPHGQVSGLGALATRDTVGSTQIEAAAVGTTKLNDGAVTNAKIAVDAVQSTQIKNEAVIADKIGPGAVTETKINTDAVTTAKIKDGAVTETKINTDAVTTAKIKDGAVTLKKITGLSAFATVDKITTSNAETLIDNQAIPQEKIAGLQNQYVKRDNLVLDGGSAFEITPASAFDISIDTTPADGPKAIITGVDTSLENVVVPNRINGMPVIEVRNGSK